MTPLIIILAMVKTTCIINNHSTYIIPDAQLCIPSFNDKMDGYFFGPCNKTNGCLVILDKCRFAKKRENYCFSRDAHFCSYQNVKNNSYYYQVECG